ncbi:hypothetical protein EHQ27_11810 [Leptospira wolffii]|uniref:hypothetical protein n=1 Tax=Leptospira wolffii TaxID=409998 RepID=UPI001082D018|nr:hypothetical protein [Leptospira wolffii]TGK62402.1 hypothetical protein EHQ32_06160 [Leptospira wolffii]TGK70658.1 hypothetical protein EHQ27_11810 [Leptospira wolffii]TGK74214.1 hypothetical protein EHQ35_07615 [Leptospira wolffii]TGL32211.1 hypothetical protein EHQ57_05060 [Leptospira wolffii]
MAFSFVLSTQNGFFRRKDLLFPDILFSVLAVALLFLGSGGSYYILFPVFLGLGFGILAYFLLAGQKSYLLYWLNHSLGFALLIPRDSRYAIQVFFAISLGIVVWWIGERKLRVRFPLALVQLLLFLLFYLLPGIQGWASQAGTGFRTGEYPDLYTSGFLTDSLPGLRYSCLEASGGFGILLFLPLLLKRVSAALLPVCFGVITGISTFIFGFSGWESLSGPVWNASVALLLLLDLPGRNTGTLLPLSFLALLPIGLAIFFVPASSVPVFLWVASFFFIESILIRIFLGDRIDKNESAPRFT